MYITSRLLRASSSAAQLEAARVVTDAVTHLNKKHDAGMRAGVQVGGDPLLFGVTGVYEHLADLEARRAALATDSAFQKILKSGDGLFGEMMEDTIWKSRIAPGAPDTYAQVSSANVQLTNMADAMTFCAEVSTTVSEIIDSAVGFATAVTGDRSRILWIGYSTNLARMEEDEEKLEASPAYIDLFKRSDGLLAPNTLEEHIWQHLAG